MKRKVKISKVPKAFMEEGGPIPKSISATNPFTGVVSRVDPAYFKSSKKTKEQRAREIEDGSKWNIQDWNRYKLPEPGIETPLIDPIDIITGGIAAKGFNFLKAGKGLISASEPIISNGFNIGTHPKTVARAVSKLSKAGGAGLTELYDMFMGKENNYTTDTFTNKKEEGGPVSNQLKSEWNGFVDFLHKKGMSGNKDLDVRDKNLGKKYLDEYLKSNPNVTNLKYDSVGVIQQDMLNYKKQAWDRIQAGKATTDAKNIDEFMPNISQYDNWLGSKTSSTKFPKVSLDGVQLGFSDPTKSTKEQQLMTLAKHKYGGQANYGLDLSKSVPYTEYNTMGDFFPSNTIKAVDRESANVEAEKGESVVADFDQDGLQEHMRIGGKKHSQGGTPLNLPGDAFIFSDTKKLKMSGSELTPFGKSDKSKKKYSPADLAKQYDINKYKAILDDPKTDKLSKDTAQLMVDNYNNKLSQLALVQEAKKGFPDGIPDMAMSYLQMLEESSGESTMEQAPSGEMKMGGSLSKFVDGGADITPYNGGRTRQGRFTPTKKDNKFNRGRDYLKSWEETIPGITKLSNEEAQGKIYDHVLRNNPDSIKDMWSTYGLTKKGLNDPKFNGQGIFDRDSLDDNKLMDLRSAYTDGYFGVRQLDPQRAQELKMYGSPAQPPINAGPITGDVVSRPQDYFTNGQTPPAKLGETPFDYMTPDKINFVQSLQNRGNLKKYLPWEASVNGVMPNPTFYDPSRELAANSESQNTQMMYNNQFSGPQSVAARNSQVAGQSATNAANILSKYNNQNVGIANQFAGVSADIMNKVQEAQSQRENRLYAGNVIANQQFDNSVAKADSQITQTAINAWNNRSGLGMINDTNPYYSLDPTTGRMIFKGGKGLNGTSSGQAKATTWKDYYDQAIGEGRSEAEAQKYASKMADGKKAIYTDKNVDGIPDMVKYSGMYNGVLGPK